MPGARLHLFGSFDHFPAKSGINGIVSLNSTACLPTCSYKINTIWQSNQGIPVDDLNLYFDREWGFLARMLTGITSKRFWKDAAFESSRRNVSGFLFFVSGSLGLGRTIVYRHSFRSNNWFGLERVIDCDHTLRFRV